MRFKLQIDEARAAYESDDIEIDECPIVAEGGGDGVWVAAWVWVRGAEDDEAEDEVAEDTEPWSVLVLDRRGDFVCLIPISHTYAPLDGPDGLTEWLIRTQTQLTDRERALLAAATQKRLLRLLEENSGVHMVTIENLKAFLIKGAG